MVTLESDREEEPSLAVSALIDCDDRWCRLQSPGPEVTGWRGPPMEPTTQWVMCCDALPPLFQSEIIHGSNALGQHDFQTRNWGLHTIW
jgi:hypothetical protein